MKGEILFVLLHNYHKIDAVLKWLLLSCKLKIIHALLKCTYSMTYNLSVVRCHEKWGSQSFIAPTERPVKPTLLSYEQILYSSCRHQAEVKLLSARTCRAERASLVILRHFLLSGFVHAITVSHRRVTQIEAWTGVKKLCRVSRLKRGVLRASSPFSQFSILLKKTHERM